MSRQKRVFALVVGILVAANALFVTCKQPTSTDKTVGADSITLDDRNGLIITEGETVRLYYTIKPSGASKSVTWDSSDKTVATVVKKDNYGELTALKAGSSTIITVRTSNGKTDECEVTVIPGGDIEDVALNTNKLALLPGEESTLLSMPIPANAKDKDVTWESDDESVAMVSEGGVVKAIAVGKATITVKTVVGGFTAECEVTVAAPIQGAVAVKSVSLDKDELSFAYSARGTTATLTAELEPSTPSNQNVTWYSSNTAVATVENIGLNATVRAVNSGSALIIVTTEDGGYFDICPVTVASPPNDAPIPGVISVTGVSLNISNLILDEGHQAALVATVMPAGDPPVGATDKRVFWRTTNPGVVTVSANGLVEAVSFGTAVITVTTIDGERVAFCSVLVKAPVVTAEPVTGVTLNTDTLTLTTGGTPTTLVPLVQPPTATNQRVSWASSNSAVARVDQDGEVSPVSVGTAIITVTTQDGGFKETCEVKVDAPPSGIILVEDVTLSINTLTLPLNGSVTLIATIIPAEADNKGVNWKSSDDKVAEVNQSGLVMVKGYGKTAIIVTTADGGKTDICNITVQAPLSVAVTSVTLTTTTLTLTLNPGGAAVTAALVPLVQPANAINKNVSWATSNPGVATVDENGLVTAVSAGTGTATAKITVTTQDGGKTAECTVTVREPPAQNVAVTRVSLNITTIMMGTTGRAELISSVEPTNATNKNVTWSSSNPAVAEVTQNGEVTAKAPGITAIYVITVDGGKSASCNVTVQAPSSNPVTGISLDEFLVELSAGETKRLTPTVSPPNATNDNITWSTSDPNVATVNSNGVITAKNEGSANITVTTQDGGYKASCAVRVSGEYISVESVTLSPKTLTVTRGRSSPLSYTIEPDDATDKVVTWDADDTSVASVMNGTVTGVGAGTTTITVIAQGNKTDTCAVTVVESDVAVTAILLYPTTLSIVEGEEAVLMSVVLPINAPNAVDWESDDEDVAIVNNGVVNAIAEGSTIIRVRSVENEAVFAECTVTVRAQDPNYVKVTGVSLQGITFPGNITLEKFATRVLTAVVAPANATNKAVQWSSDNPDVATVVPSGANNVTGTVTAVNPGNAIIYVTTEDSALMTFCNIRVPDPSDIGTGTRVSGISLDRTEIDDVLLDSGPITLTATITPSNADNKAVTWRSMSESVATVVSGTLTGNTVTGIVTIAGPGRAIITVITEDGGYQTACIITVLPGYIPVETIRLSRTAVEVKKDGQIALSVVYGPATTTERGVTWETDAGTIATVSNGVVTGVSPGVAIITATSDFNLNLKARCTVTVTQSVGFGITFDDMKDKTLTISGGLTLSRASSTPLTLTLTEASQYDSISWKVNGTTIEGNTGTFNLTATQFSAYGLGKYFIAVEVKKGNALYSKRVTLELVE